MTQQLVPYDVYADVVNKISLAFKDTKYIYQGLIHDYKHHVVIPDFYEFSFIIPPNENVDFIMVTVRTPSDIINSEIEDIIVLVDDLVYNIMEDFNEGDDEQFV